MELPSPFLGSDLCFLEHRLGQCESAGPGLSLLRSLRTCSCPERTACLLDDLVDLAWERLHSGVWSRVDSVWRDLYAWSTLALVTSRLAAAALEDPAPLVELVDLALVLGAEAFRSRLEDLMEALEREMELWRRKKVELCRRVDEAPRMAAEVDEFSSELYPTLEEFLDSMKAEKPLVIRGLVKDWPALRWNEDMEMLVESIAHRVVPVEIGSKYTDRNWAQRMMTIEQFATRFLRDDAIEQGYIAQHDLFRQIKALRNQISIPGAFTPFHYACILLLTIECITKSTAV